jgi:hypothetical protein
MAAIGNNLSSDDFGTKKKLLWLRSKASFTTGQEEGHTLNFKEGGYARTIGCVGASLRNCTARF